MTNLFFVLSVSGFTDVFAYLSGLLFGKTQMSKVISPKKTWEGFFIGLFVTILASLLLIYFISFGVSTTYFTLSHFLKLLLASFSRVKFDSLFKLGHVSVYTWRPMQSWLVVVWTGLDSGFFFFLFWRGCSLSFV